MHRVCKAPDVVGKYKAYNELDPDHVLLYGLFHIYCSNILTMFLYCACTNSQDNIIIFSLIIDPYIFCNDMISGF